MITEKGKIYSCKHGNVPEGRCVFLATYDNNLVKRVTYNHHAFYIGSSFDYGLSDVRKATKREENWLKACIKANKYIPFEKIKEEFIKYVIY